MIVFDKYAHYYDLLYHDKDYVAETQYVDKLIGAYQPGARDILDLGCGTGNHDFNLADRGYRVTGIDRSRVNIENAKFKLAKRVGNSSELNFLVSDIRGFQLDQSFDVVISLFHVMSYLQRTVDLKAALKSVSAHLKPGGLFIFDCWYGPAVLTERPLNRVKTVENETMRVIRIAEPELRPNENMVVVNFLILIFDKATGKVSEVREKHPMRYFFKPEIDQLLIEAGFTSIDCVEWLTEKPPKLNTWNACFIQKC